MELALAVGLACGFAAGALLGALGSLAIARRRARAPRLADPPVPPGPVPAVPEISPRPGKDAPVWLDRRSLDELRVGVLVLDAGDRPVLANPAAREMGLLRAGATAGSPPVAPTAVRALAGRARRTGAWLDADLDLARCGGRDRLGVRIRAVALGEGYVTLEAADVTESHRVERVRRDFMANVSHELKTPVGALRLLADALLEATGTPADAAGTPAGATEPFADARRFAHRIHHESVRLSRLVADLLELSRLQGGEPLPAPSPVPVDRIVAEVTDRTRTAATAKGIEVTFTGVRGLTVYGSERQLVTAVANLVDNAVAYSPEAVSGEAAAPVTISARIDDEYVEIAVNDQGIGIEAKDIDRIFERFYRADKARSRSTGGTGLGLAIVKHIVTNHGGQIDVVSTAGVGSTFTLRLSARPPEHTECMPVRGEAP